MRTSRIPWVRRRAGSVFRCVFPPSLALIGFACSSEGGPSTTTWETGADSVAADGIVCVDGDGDGYGADCAKGLDCDDEDAAVTDECRRCSSPGIEGCPCVPPGAVVCCGRVTERLANGILECGPGSSRCAVAGVWSACQLDRTMAVPEDGGVSNPR